PGDLRRRIGLLVTWWAAPALAASAYYILVLIGALRWRGAMPRAGWTVAAVSILKPIRGRDPEFYDAIRSHAAQDYPEFEILFGAGNPHDPALPDIERLKREFPGRRIEIVIAPTDAPNAKAGVLAELAGRARYPVLLVNDSDI